MTKFQTSLINRTALSYFIAKIAQTNQCLSEFQVIGYVRQTLSAEKRIEVENHISTCLSCLDQIVAFYSMIKREETNLLVKAVEEYLEELHVARIPYDGGGKQQPIILKATVLENDLSPEVSPIFEVKEGPWLEHDGRFTLRLYLPERRVFDEDLQHLQVCRLNVYFRGIPLGASHIEGRTIFFETSLLEINDTRLQAIFSRFGNLSQLFLYSPRRRTISLSLNKSSQVPALTTPVPVKKPIWIGENTRQLAKDVELRAKIDKGGKREARFEGLTEWLSSSVIFAYAPVQGPVRRGSDTEGQGQILPLADEENNLLIRTAIQAANQGRSHLSVEVCDLESKQPLGRTQVSLQEHKGQGEQMTDTNRQGKAIFVELEPGQYTIEVKPIVGEKAGWVWRFTLTLEST